MMEEKEMKLEEVRIKNFRGIADARISFADITTLVGRNDAGKSSVLSALDAFFNKQKLNDDDINVQARNVGCDSVDVEIACIFSGPFAQITLDESERTSFTKECLIRHDGKLELCKTFQAGRTAKMVAICNLAIDSACEKLFTSDNAALKRICEKRKCACRKKTSNVQLRAAIREDVMRGKALTDVPCELTGKRLEGVLAALPCYMLFVADRENMVGDNVVMSPMKAAVRTALESKRVRGYIAKVEKAVREELASAVKGIRVSLKEFDSKQIDSVRPDFPSVDIQRWCDAFRQFTLRSDDGVSLDNRGSGVRRLVLMSFLHAQSLKRFGADRREIIYAIEEPETSQHSDNQVKIAAALLKLSKRENSQVVLTTHSGQMLKQLADTKIQVVSKCNGITCVSSVELSGSKELYVKPLSLVEVSYLLLGDCVSEYHCELYGHIERNGLNLASWCKKQAKMGRLEYMCECSRKNDAKEAPHPYPTFVRDRLHHPENKKYDQVSEASISKSIMMMREFMKDDGKTQLQHKSAKTCF